MCSYENVNGSYNRDMMLLANELVEIMLHCKDLQSERASVALAQSSNAELQQQRAPLSITNRQPTASLLENIGLLNKLLPQKGHEVGKELNNNVETIVNTIGTQPEGTRKVSIVKSNSMPQNMQLSKTLTSRQRRRMRHAARTGQKLLQQEIERLLANSVNCEQTSELQLTNAKKKLLLKETRKAQRMLQAHMDNLNKECVTQATKPQSTTVNTPEVQPQSSTNNVTEKRISPQQFRRFAQDNRQAIGKLRLSLEAEADCAPNNAQSKLIVAIITFANGESIVPHMEYIRTEMIGWIGKYQHHGFTTPIFHGISNSGTAINIICENAYAYSCVEHCVLDVRKACTLAPITLFREPTISIYCYEAIYMDTTRDSSLFLTQVQLHWVELQAERWIVVHHEVHTERRETYFLLLLDEQSALTLHYHHNNKLFVCMQTVKFMNCGRLPEDDE